MTTSLIFFYGICFGDFIQSLWLITPVDTVNFDSSVWTILTTSDMFVFEVIKNAGTRQAPEASIRKHNTAS